MKALRLSLVFCFAVIGALAQAPTVATVVNSASNLLPGLPNAPVAQGALFIVYGTNLGPATLAKKPDFPLTTSIGGTSMQVTVGSTTVDVIMFYALDTQVAGILPSKTPTGTGTVKVTYNGQSASGPITVVQNNLGIFTVGSNGIGDAIAFVNIDNGLITPTHAANPGEVISIWGTGLGPVTGDETQAAVQTNITSIPLHVFIGGKDVGTPLFQGRNACCTSVDSIYVTVPAGVSGCNVSVLMQIGNFTSNATSIAVADSGRTCTPISQNQTGGGTGTHTFGGLALERVVENVSTAGFSSTTKEDLIGGAFLKITYTNSTPPQGSQIDINSYGSCIVFVSQVNGKVNKPPAAGTITYLDAGAKIGLAAPFGNRDIPKSTPAAGFITYSATLDQTATTLAAGQYTFTGTGGADVGAFTATYTLPPPFVWTNQSDVTTINRANGVTVNWTGGDPAGYVNITGESTLYITAKNTIGVSFTCTARDSDLTFTVPPVVLLALPVSGAVPGTSFLIPGSLSLAHTSGATPFQAPGIEAAAITSAFIYVNTVTFQ